MVLFMMMTLVLILCTVCYSIGRDDGKAKNKLDAEDYVDMLYKKGKRDMKQASGGSWEQW